jgi:hypothetical protein
MDGIDMICQLDICAVGVGVDQWSRDENLFFTLYLKNIKLTMIYSPPFVIDFMSTFTTASAIEKIITVDRARCR